MGLGFFGLGWVLVGLGFSWALVGLGLFWTGSGFSWAWAFWAGLGFSWAWASPGCVLLVWAWVCSCFVWSILALFIAHDLFMAAREEQEKDNPTCTMYNLLI